VSIRPWEIDRQRGGSTPRTGLFGAPQNPYAEASALPMSPQQALAQEGLGPLAGGQPGRRRPAPPLPPPPLPTGPTVTDDGEGGDTSTRQVRPYPTVLPPLSPDMLAALEARRAASARQLTEAEARAASQRQRAELANVGRLLGIEEETARERREGMAELAARGVARSPLFANPFRRELARQQQEQIAESQQTLANTLDQLNVALNAARQRRESELAQIAFETAQARSNVNRLMGLA